MALVIDNRTLVLNGSSFNGQAVVDDVSGDIFLPSSLVAETGALIESGAASINIDRLPIVSLAKNGNKVQVVRIPGSPMFDTGTRSTPVAQTDSDGNTLTLNAQVVDGKLTDLSGTLEFANQNVTADVTFKFQGGVLQPSGQITFTSGNFSIKISGNPDSFEGDLTYASADCNIALKVQAGSNTPTSISLSVTVRF